MTNLNIFQVCLMSCSVNRIKYIHIMCLKKKGVLVTICLLKSLFAVWTIICTLSLSGSSMIIQELVSDYNHCDHELKK